MSHENLGNLLRDVIGRLERIEDSGTTPTRRTESTPPVPIARTRHQHQYQDSEIPGPSCSTSTLPFNRRFYPYNPPSERNRIFRPSRNRQNSHPKTKKIEKWRHEFVCLANKNQYRVPLPLEKIELVHANLGPLHLELTLNGDAQLFHEELLKFYPKLESCGGYELLRGSDTNNKELTVITPPMGGYTALFLKSVVSHAKIYIRPLQANLSLSPNINEDRVSAFCSSICVF